MSRPSKVVGRLIGPSFVDTSAFYALLDAEDPHHRKSVGLFTQLGQSRTRLLTSNHVLFETYSLILNRLGRRLAHAWLKTFAIHVERATAQDEERAVQIVLRYRDKDVSLVDASSFALMERLGLRTAVAYDPHFRQYGRFVVLQQPMDQEEAHR